MNRLLSAVALLLLVSVLGAQAGADRIEFEDQPSVITTNLAEFPVCGYTGGSDYRISVNGGPKLKTSGRGYRVVVDLGLGANTITAAIYDNHGRKKKSVTKTVICDPRYRMSKRELLYAADDKDGDTVVIDTVGGYIVGCLSGVAIVAATPDGKWIVDNNENYISVDNPSLVRPSPYGKGYCLPLFSLDGHYVWSGQDRADLWSWTLLNDYNLPVDIDGDYDLARPDGTVLTSDWNYETDKTTYWTLRGDQAEKSFTLKGWLGGKIDPTGKHCVRADYAFAFGTISVRNLKTGRITEFDELSDFMGHVVFTPDGKYAIAGSFGNSYYGGGKLYVVDVPNQKLKGSCERVGSNSVAISPSGRTVYCTSRWIDYEYGSDMGDPDHRGVEVYKFSNGRLSLSKTYYLKAPAIYPYPPDHLLVLKPARR